MMILTPVDAQCLIAFARRRTGADEHFVRACVCWRKHLALLSPAYSIAFQTSQNHRNDLCFNLYTLMRSKPRALKQLSVHAQTEDAWAMAGRCEQFCFSLIALACCAVQAKQIAAIHGKSGRHTKSAERKNKQGGKQKKMGYRAAQRAPNLQFIWLELFSSEY